MSDSFIDSNIFVYMFDETDDVKRGIAETLVIDAIEQRYGVISFQVVQETLNVMTRELRVPIQPEAAKRILTQVLAPLWRVMPTSQLYQRALEIQARYGYAFYDSLIIAAALEAGCTRLYSEDFQHGQRIEGMTIENPFTH